MQARGLGWEGDREHPSFRLCPLRWKRRWPIRSSDPHGVRELPSQNLSLGWIPSRDRAAKGIPVPHEDCAEGGSMTLSDYAFYSVALFLGAIAVGMFGIWFMDRAEEMLGD
jgi:hypothetical protein